MAIDPNSLLLMLSLAGLDFAGGLLGSDPIPGAVPLEGVDLSALLRQGQQDLGTIGRTQASRAETPVTLPSSFAQDPPSFSGGGLPMDIGVTGSDPALSNPALLSSPFLPNFGEASFTPSAGSAGAAAAPAPPPPASAPTNGPGSSGSQLTRPGITPSTPVTPERRLGRPGLGPQQIDITPTDSSDLIEDQGARALAAIDLMLAALQEPQRAR